VFDYEGSGKLRTAKPGSLEFFLLERYLLFSESRGGKIYCGKVQHSPYQFTEARVRRSSKAPLKWEKFSVENEPTSQLYSPGVPVSINPLRHLY
jgi:uncharacterized protein YqjF (DUF2071 family)